jgi:MinD-like ATPase involved in chromosome partitioning or flagellar assembly
MNGGIMPDSLEARSTCGPDGLEGLFRGAVRTKSYDAPPEEPAGEGPAVEESAPIVDDDVGPPAQAGSSTPDAASTADPWSGYPVHSAVVVRAGQPATPAAGVGLLPERPPKPTAGHRRRATIGWRRSLGLNASDAEAAWLADRAIVRQSTWGEPIRIVVANPKGGSGKTPAALVLGGILASIRGGYVAVWDASDAKGDLGDRAEGEIRAGVVELAGAADRIASVGQVGAYTAPQSSHADVIASPASRALSAEEVKRIRGVLGAAYRIEVADTGNVAHSEVFQAVLADANALVVPTSVQQPSITSAVELLAELARDPSTVGLASRAVVVVTHAGGSEHPAALRYLHESLDALGVAVCLDVPYDETIAAAGPISLEDLTHESEVAWTRVAAAVCSSGVASKEMT